MSPSSHELFAIAYVQGDRHELEELAKGNSTESREKLQALVGHGLRSFCVSEQPPWYLAAQAAKASRAMVDMSPDLLVYASDTDHDAASSLARLAIEVGLADVRSIAIGGHECANLGNAIMLAEDALASGRQRCALVVTADSAYEKPRVMRNGISVFSDGAAALHLAPQELVPVDAPTRAHVVSSAIEINLSPWGGSETAKLVNTVELAGHLVDRLSEQTGRTPAEWRYVILPNYQQPSQLLLASALGAKPHQILTGDVASDAHCFGADVLITFSQVHGRLVEEGGGPVALVAPGPCCWYLLELECV